MRKNIFISACLIALCVCTPSFAQTNSAYFDCKSDTIVVSGEISGASLGEGASIFIAPSENEMFIPILSDMFYMENEKNFSKDIHLHSSFVPGKYEIRAGSENSTSPYKGTVIIFDENSTEINSLMDDINECRSSNDLAELMSSEGKDKLFVTDSQYFGEAIKLCFEIKQLMPGKKFDAQGFVDSYYYAYASAMLLDGIAPNDVMEKYSRFFGATYEDYASSAVKDEIDALCPEFDYGAEFMKLETMEIIAKIRSFDNVGNLWDFVENEYKTLGITDSVMREYNKLSTTRQNNVFGSVIKKTGNVTSLLKFAELFENEVDNQADESNKKTSSSGRGGSSGSSFGGAVNNPPLQTQVSVSVSDVDKTEKKEIEFYDINNHWAKDDVYALVNRGVIDGYTDSTFRPDGYVTRAELSKLIAKAFGFSNSNHELPFGDVDKDSWYYDSVAALSETGIITGDGAGFKPNSFITRQDSATMISRALIQLGIKSKEAPVIFDDKDDISDYAAQHIENLSSLGIINGSDNHFYPLNNITRAEISAIINRAYKTWGGTDK